MYESRYLIFVEWLTCLSSASVHFWELHIDDWLSAYTYLYLSLHNSSCWGMRKQIVSASSENCNLKLIIYVGCWILNSRFWCPCASITFYLLWEAIWCSNLEHQLWSLVAGVQILPETPLQLYGLGQVVWPLRASVFLTLKWMWQ